MKKPQVPAEGISLLSEFKDAAVFRADCECSTSEHSIMAWIEVAKEADDDSRVEVSFYVTTWAPIWAGWRQRLKAVYEILFKGEHRQEHHLILTNQAGLNLANAISKTVKKLEKKHVR